MKLNNSPILLIVISVLAVCFSSAKASAAPKLFDGREEINGVTLLQDVDDEDKYYYVPPFPRLARLANGQLAFSFMRYSGGENSGGATLNAMVEFALPPEYLGELDAALRSLYPDARIAGPVALTDPADDLEGGEQTTASFELVSATIGMPTTRSVTSGSAPIGSGGQAAIAARLGAEDAALMWTSFQVGAMTDIAFEVDAAYLARIEAFNAVVEAEMSTVYTHFSEIQNVQEGMTRDQIREITDSLLQNQTMTVRSTDTGGAFDISSARQEKLLELITEKLVSVMFDAEAGWSRPVNPEDPVPEGQIPGRIEGGTISGSMLGVALFGGSIGYAEHTDYVPDDQYLLRNREDIRVNTFRLDLTRSQMIRVPYRTTGNIGSAYANLGDDSRYFNYVNLDQQTDDRREVLFSLDSNYADAFEKVLDGVVVDVQHGTGDQTMSYTRRLHSGDVSDDRLSFEKITLARVDADDGNWDAYRYRTSWYIRGQSDPLLQPGHDEWAVSHDVRPTLTPPLQRRPITISLDSEVFDGGEVRVATVDIMSRLAGQPRILETVRSVIDNPKLRHDIVIYHDPNAAVAYRTSFTTRSGTLTSSPEYIQNDFVFVFPPAAEDADNE